MSGLVEHFDEYLQALSEGETPREPPLSEDELRAAIAVLLVQVLRADLRVKEGEIEAVVDAIENVLGLDRDSAMRLARLGARRARSSDAMRLAVRCADRCLTRAQRVDLAERLWRIALADAELSGQEEYLVRKVAELLGLTTADLVEAKVRAKEAL